MVGLGLIVVMVVLALGAPLFTSADPADMDTNAILQSPTKEHIFGTDDLGRDVFSRVLYGARISIFVGVVVAGITAITGIFFGILSGFYRRLDNPVMRTMDIVMAFPAIMLALAVVAILGPQLANIIIALVIPYTPRTARVVRGSVLQLKEMDFVTGARSIGAKDWRIMGRHLLPNSMAPLLVQLTYILALAILAEAALTFLGVGVPPEVPTLGGIISDARVNLRYAPWLSLYPGLAISALVLGFNLLGDGLRDILDPRMKQ
jgi:peptide/nickel transport system permease protein